MSVVDLTDRNGNPITSARDRPAAESRDPELQGSVAAFASASPRQRLVFHRQSLVQSLATYSYRAGQALVLVIVLTLLCAAGFVYSLWRHAPQAPDGFDYAMKFVTTLCVCGVCLYMMFRHGYLGSRARVEECKIKLRDLDGSEDDPPPAHLKPVDTERDYIKSAPGRGAAAA